MAAPTGGTQPDAGPTTDDNAPAVQHAPFRALTTAEMQGKPQVYDYFIRLLDHHRKLIIAAASNPSISRKEAEVATVLTRDRFEEDFKYVSERSFRLIYRMPRSLFLWLWEAIASSPHYSPPGKNTISVASPRSYLGALLHEMGSGTATAAVAQAFGLSYGTYNRQRRVLMTRIQAVCQSRPETRIGWPSKDDSE